MDNMLFQNESQINGTYVHETIDSNEYSDKKTILQGMSVYSDEYCLVGKIDIFDNQNGILTERKNHISNIYDGFIMQLYAQCIALREMGYIVNKICLYSYSDNKSYHIKLPEEDIIMFEKFRQLINEIHNFKIDAYRPLTSTKCENCIYEPLCDRSLIEVDDVK